MNENNKVRRKKTDTASPAGEHHALVGSGTNSADVAGILDERIRNLSEAIEEIDAALAPTLLLKRAFTSSKSSIWRDYFGLPLGVHNDS